MTSFKDRLLTPYTGLKVDWFDAWHPALDDALREIPELEACSHELYRLLIQNPGPVRKRIALITEQGAPVAVACLRQKSRFLWEPILQWIIPGEPFPSKPGYLLRVIDALNLEVWVAWWRVEKEPGTSPLMRYIEATPTYRMRCSDDFEEYWRETGHFKTIRRIRNRCAELKLVVNTPGSAEWTIRNCEEKWREKDSPSDPGLADKILAANFMENQKQYYTFVLMDGETMAGGATMLVHQKDLVAGVMYREPEYHKQGVGDRLIDICFSFAKENGFEFVDIGGGHEYKKQWAPLGGERWWFNICPEPLYLLKETVNLGKRLVGKRAKTEIPQNRTD